MKLKVLFLVAALGSIGLGRADEIQFTTLPQAVQTTVIRETHIVGPTSVTRVVRETNGVYAVTVNAESGQRVVYVNDAGTVVQVPAGSSTTTTTTTTVQRAEPATESAVVTTEQVQSDSGRYQLLEKKGNKEVYLDRQTGQKVKVKRESND
ncbi:MAG: hypothetical protein JO069_13765 [Verrucomicrobia bacterium]|nr:hypothetical protein [Verrucomicrobiota bacterium]